MRRALAIRRFFPALPLALVVCGAACAGTGSQADLSGAGGADRGGPQSDTGGSGGASAASGVSGSGGAPTPASGGSGGASGQSGEIGGSARATGGAAGGAETGARAGAGSGAGSAGGGPAGAGDRTGAAGSAGAAPASGGAIGSGGVAGAPGLASVCYPNAAHDHDLNNDNWAGTLTLFISYSADTRSQTVDKGYTPAAWNAAVSSFDVPSFANQVANTGAQNILLMLGQNTGYYDSPNAIYETYAGVAANTRCSHRDLPMEIADALAAKGIGLYLYLPEDVGWGDTKAAAAFGLTTQAVGNWVVDGTFTPKWNAVIKTWADRYGSKVRGWFFDGYEARWGVTAAMANSYSATCKAANPCAAVTFNGTGSDSVSDTQRGETAIDTSTGLPAKGLPTSRWDKNGLQVMWDFPLQAAWGQEIADNSPAIYTNANLKAFITAAVKAQAVFALDVRTSLAGALSTPIYDQLLAIKP
jgi:hypothetical protein